MTSDHKRTLAKLKALKSIGHKIIAFLAQLEDFQKKLWLKKKFVVETNWCITLDRVPEELYAEIAANDAQKEEWVKLFAIDDLKGYGKKLSVPFLKANPFLVLDTAFFSGEFKAKLLGSIESIDEMTNGLLVHSDNFQALNLLHTQYKELVKCIYIDPPYNTASSSIPYKNNYKHSSWATLMRDRLSLMRELMPNDGAIYVSIDKVERTILEHTLDDVFGAHNRIEELIWSMNTNNSQAPNYSTNHEYVEVYAKNRVMAENNKNMFREPKPGFEEVMALVTRLGSSYPPISEIEAEIKALYDKHRLEFKEETEASGLEWEDEKGNDPWKGLFNYSRAEYRDSEGKIVSENEAKQKKAVIWVWQEGDASMPATKQAASTRDPGHPNWRFYNPIHPVTKKPSAMPKSGWKFAYKDDEGSPDKRSFVSLDRDGRIAWGADEKKVPRLKRMLHEVETNVGKSVFQDYSDGEKQTSAMFGKSGVFLAPKHADFVSRFIIHAAKEDSTILDCFGGSGSTAHAVIKLNRDNRGKRKYITVEVGNYFDTVTKPRICKAIYSKDWRNGKPLSREGIGHCLKYVRLESYEDTLNNLTLNRSKQAQGVLDADRKIREQFLLNYMLDTESKGSVLNLSAFTKPFDYQFMINRNDDMRLRKIDLVETFNYLIGLHVERMRFVEDVYVVSGKTRGGKNTIILWRDAEKLDAAKLDKWFDKNRKELKASDFDLIYVNGDNTLQGQSAKGDRWTVKLIEEAFHRLMFNEASL